MLTHRITTDLHILNGLTRISATFNVSEFLYTIRNHINRLLTDSFPTATPSTNFHGLTPLKDLHFLHFYNLHLLP